MPSALGSVSERAAVAVRNRAYNKYGMQEHWSNGSSGPIYLSFFLCQATFELLLAMDVSGNGNSVGLSEICKLLSCFSETLFLVIPKYFKLLLGTALLPLPTYSGCQFEKMLFLLFKTFPEYFYRYHCGVKKRK